MKVGVIVDNEYHSDVRVKREVSLLKNLGYQISILCLSFDKPTYKEEGVEVVQIPLPRKLKDILYFFMNLIPIYEWWWKRKVKQFLQGRSIDIVHTHDLYMAKCVKKGIISSGTNVPMILDLHENYPHAIQSYKWSQGFLRALLVQPKSWIKKEKRYLNYADRIVVLSDGFKKELLSKYPSLDNRRWVVFPNVVDTEAFDQYPVKAVDSKLPEKPRLLYFGMVADRRGIFRTLAACEKLLERNLHFSLVIIGPVDSGDKDRFFETIREPIFEDKLLYIPWIDLPELPSYLNACDIALAPFDKNPQHESGIANKIFQYMYGSLPIVASNCKPQQELIESHQIGEVFTTDEEFVKKLEQLIANEEERKEIGIRANEVLRTKFHQDAFKDTFISIYED